MNAALPIPISVDSIFRIVRIVSTFSFADPHLPRARAVAVGVCFVPEPRFLFNTFHTSVHPMSRSY
jgi:hypothetical protein